MNSTGGRALFALLANGHLKHRRSIVGPAVAKKWQRLYGIAVCMFSGLPLYDLQFFLVATAFYMYTETQIASTHGLSGLYLVENDTIQYIMVIKKRMDKKEYI